MTHATAMLVTADDSLLDDMLRLSAAAGVVLDVAHDTSAAARGWAVATVVLVGADLAEPLAARRVPRRDQVVVVGRSPVGDTLFRAALAVGAEHVAELPAAETWLAELLTDVADGGATRGLTIGVVGGSGGVGATTLACALGLTAATRGPALLVDLDPLGPGVDRVVGLEEADGVRWEGLLESPGRLGARSLREALPSREGLGVVTWAADSGPLDAGCVRDVLSAGQRGHGTVVVDLARRRDEVVSQAVAHCDRVLVVCGLQVPAVASAARVVDALEQEGARLGLVARRPRASSLDPEQVAGMLDLPLLGTVPDQRRLAEHVDLGLGPVHAPRGPLARLCRTVLHRLSAGVEAAA